MKTTKSMTELFNRADYIAGRCSHREYYGQFVNQATKNTVSGRIGSDRICQSKDEHFNDIRLTEWDNLSAPYAIRFAAVGDFPTAAGRACILKEAAQQIREEAQP